LFFSEDRMTRRLSTFAAGAVLVAGLGCASDPTGDLSGDPALIVTSADLVFIPAPGDSVLVTAELWDAQGVPLPTVPDAATADASVVTVSTADLPPLSIRRFYVKGVAAGSTTINLTAGSVTKSVQVVVFPATFDGAISVSSGARLDTITIAASGTVGFDASGATSVLLDGEPTLTVALSATEIKVLALSTGPLTDAEVTLVDVVFLPGTEDIALPSIVAAATASVSGEADEPANDAFDDAPGAIVLGQEVVGSLSGSDVDDYFVLTLAAPATITLTGMFGGTGGDPDIDFYILSDAGDDFCDLDDCAAATGAQPEEATSLAVLPAGTYYINVNLFDVGDAAEPVWYRLLVVSQ
jgi:hypothetical protein